MINQLGFFHACRAALSLLRDLKNIFVVLEGIQFALQLGSKILTSEGENPVAIAVQACELFEDMI